MLLASPLDLSVFYEVPVAQHRDFDDASGLPPGSDAIGLGDANVKFIGNPDSGNTNR